MQTQNASTIGPLHQRFNNIMNSRLSLTMGHAGQVVKCQVSGNPKYGYYDPKLDALKDIYSFNVSKTSVEDSPWFIAAEAEAIALEIAGQTEMASELFDKLLNQSQLTLGIINRDGTKPQFSRDQVVDLFIGTAKVEDKKDGVPQGTFHMALIVKSITATGVVTLSQGRRRGAPVVSEAAPAPVAANAPAASAPKATDLLEEIAIED